MQRALHTTCSVWRIPNACRSDLASTIYAAMWLSHSTTLSFHMKWTMDIARLHNRQPQDHADHNSLSWKQTNTIRELIPHEQTFKSRLITFVANTEEFEMIRTQVNQKFSAHLKNGVSPNLHILVTFIAKFSSSKKVEAAHQTFHPATWVWVKIWQNKRKKTFYHFTDSIKYCTIAQKHFMVIFWFFSSLCPFFRLEIKLTHKLVWDWGMWGVEQSPFF